MIKNLAQMKRALVKGARFEMVMSNVHPETVGQIRMVNVTHTNGIYSVVDGDPAHEISMANYGKGYWMPFGYARNWSFEGGLCTGHRIDGEPVFSIRIL